MTPEDVPAVPQNGLASRVARVEADVANLNHLLRAVAPLVGDFRELAEAQRGLRDSLNDLKREWREDVKHFDAAITELAGKIDKVERNVSDRDDAVRKDRKSDLRWMAGFAVSSAVLVIAALGLLLG